LVKESPNPTRVHPVAAGLAGVLDDSALGAADEEPAVESAVGSAFDDDADEQAPVATTRQIASAARATPGRAVCDTVAS
jgi:hypothetical protein